MGIDNLFEDCDKIARHYEQNVADVVTHFTLVELSWRTNHKRPSYKLLIHDTERYFSSVYGRGVAMKKKDVGDCIVMNCDDKAVTDGYCRKCYEELDALGYFK